MVERADPDSTRRPRALDGEAVDSMDRLFRLLTRIPPRSTVTLALLRHGRAMELARTTTDAPA